MLCSYMEVHPILRMVHSSQRDAIDKQINDVFLRVPVESISKWDHTFNAMAVLCHHFATKMYIYGWLSLGGLINWGVECPFEPAPEVA